MFWYLYTYDILRKLRSRKREYITKRQELIDMVL